MSLDFQILEMQLFLLKEEMMMLVVLKYRSKQTYTGQTFSVKTMTMTGMVEKRMVSLLLLLNELHML